MSSQREVRSRIFAERLARVRAHPFWSIVFFPWLVTRSALALAGWFALSSFLPNPTYAELWKRGYFLSRFGWLDLWLRWDAKWYLSIVEQGYQAGAGLGEQYSNVAFFPLYPYLIKALRWLLPFGHASDSLALALGLLVSNSCLLAAGWLLYRMLCDLGGDDLWGKRSVELLMVFPASFFFSSFYPESLFLLLTIGALRLGLRHRWGWAALLGGLAAVTRGQGVVIAVPLAWMYADSIGWNPRRLRVDCLWLALIPLALAAHLALLYPLTGEWMTPMVAQAAWGRWQGGLWENLIAQFSGAGLDVFKIDLILLAGFLVAAVALLRMPRLRALGIYALVMLALPIATGLLVSISRYLAIIFPVYMLLAQLPDTSRRYQLLRALFFALQVAYFMGFVNYYWIA